MGLLGDIWDGAKSVGETAFGLTPLGLGANLATSEDARSKIPILNSLTGAESDAQKALIKKQNQLADEARKRQVQMQEARMNALGQSMLAFAPRNAMMAQMFGPQAAFTPQQMGQMVQNPMPQQQWGTGTDQERVDQVKSRDEQRKRQAMMDQAFGRRG